MLATENVLGFFHTFGRIHGVVWCNIKYFKLEQYGYIGYVSLMLVDTPPLHSVADHDEIISRDN